MSRVVKYTYRNEEVASSAIEAVWYDLVNQELFVEFPNGRLAGYRSVPPSKVKEMLNSLSIGSYFSRSIKAIYPGTSSDVSLEPYNHLSNSNTNPAVIGNPPPKQEEPETEVEEADENNGIYEVEFIIEGRTEFSAPEGDVLKALNLFVGGFNENNEDAQVRVRSIREIV